MTYKALDGTEFEHVDECLDYEQNNKFVWVVSHGDIILGIWENEQEAVGQQEAFSTKFAKVSCIVLNKSLV